MAKIQIVCEKVTQVILEMDNVPAEVTDEHRRDIQRFVKEYGPTTDGFDDEFLRISVWRTNENGETEDASGEYQL